jgi:hypothetical protein
LIVDTIAYFEYWEGKSVSGGWERLELIVKFKESGKLFKTKLEETLATTFGVSNPHVSNRPYKSYDEYFKDVEFFLSDTYTIERVVERMVTNHFKHKDQNNYKEERSKNISDRVSKMNKMQIKVTIK